MVFFTNNKILFLYNRLILINFSMILITMSLHILSKPAGFKLFIPKTKLYWNLWIYQFSLLFDNNVLWLFLFCHFITKVAINQLFCKHTCRLSSTEKLWQFLGKNLTLWAINLTLKIVRVIFVLLKFGSTENIMQKFNPYRWK